MNGHKAFTTALKKRKVTLDFAKISKRALTVLTKKQPLDESETNLYQNDGKRNIWRMRKTGNDPKHII